jgi:Family of unknown function (DUF5684)
MTSIFSLSFLATLWTNSTLLAQMETDVQTPAAPSPAVMIISLLVTVLVIAAMWKVFAKAGQPGWAAIIPIVNIYFLCKVAGRPGWWLILMFIPIVNFVIWIILSIDVAKNFGKGAGFGLGLAFLWVIFFPILGFGSATYQGSAAPAAIA